MALSDTFTGSNGTALTSHTSDSGHSWTTHGSYTGAPEISDTNRLRNAAGGPFTLCYASWAPTSADYYVQADFYPKSLLSGTAISARTDTSANTNYVVSYEVGPDQFNLYKCIAGVFTSLGTYATTLALNTAVTVKLECIGTAIKVYVNGTQRISVTNGDITAAGRAGVRFAGASSNTTRVHLDTLSADDIATTRTTTFTADAVVVARSSFTADGLVKPIPGTLYSSSTHSSVVCGVDRFSQVTLVYDHGNSADSLTTPKVERSSDGSTWADVSAASHIVITSLGGNVWKIVDRRPQYGSQAVTYGGTARYRVSPKTSLLTGDPTSASALNPDVDEASFVTTRSATIHGIISGQAGGYVPYSANVAYPSYWLLDMAYAYYYVGSTSYRTDALAQLGYLQTLDDANGVCIQQWNSKAGRDYQWRNVVHAALAGRLLRLLGDTTNAQTLIDQADTWAQAGIDRLATSSLTTSHPAANTQTAWQASHAYTLGAIVRPTTGNGRTYRCTVAGTSSGSQPTWPTTGQATVTDGTVTWTESSATVSVYNSEYAGTSPYASSGQYSADLNQNLETALGLALLYNDPLSDFSVAGAYRTTALTQIKDNTKLAMAYQASDGGIYIGSLDSTKDTLYGGYVVSLVAGVRALMGSTGLGTNLDQQAQGFTDLALTWFDTSYGTEPLGTLHYDATTTIGPTEASFRDAGYRLRGRTNPLDKIWLTAAFNNSSTDYIGSYDVNGASASFLDVQQCYNFEYLALSTVIPTVAATFTTNALVAARSTSTFTADAIVNEPPPVALPVLVTTSTTEQTTVGTRTTEQTRVIVATQEQTTVTLTHTPVS